MDNWKLYPQNKPEKYGHYYVYRQKCDKVEKQTWNTSGWAYNNKDITNFREIDKPDIFNDYVWK